MNKDKLVSLILKKQTYKETKPVQLLIQKQNQQTIKYSINAIDQILTKQYNTQSKLYAIRFLKDSFQMGSPKFIKAVQESILPILVNIIIDSTDEKAIMKYAGSSFTKNSDLSKYKSVVSSMFTMVKQCIYKWAEWLSNDQYKFHAAFLSLQKENVRFDYELQYFRVQNEQNFRQNCKKNNLILPTLRRHSQTKLQVQKQQKNPQQQKFKLGQRMIKPNTKDKYALHIYELFEQYDKRILNGQLTDFHINEMQSKFNELLNFYLQKSKQFSEDYMQQCFNNMENIKKDYERSKTSKQSAVKSPKNLLSNQINKSNSLKKIQTVRSSQKIQHQEQATPAKLIPKVQKPNIPKSPKQIQQVKPYLQEKEQAQTPVKSQIKEQAKGQSSQKFKSRKDRIQKLKSKQLEKEKQHFQKVQFKSEVKYIESDQSQESSFLIQKQNKNNEKIQKIQKGQKVQQESSKSKQSNKKVKQYSDTNSYDRQNTNKSGKPNRQQFDSHLSVSQNSSRVNFSQSSQDEHQQSSELEPSLNFKKQKPKLSSIAEEDNEGGYGQTSRQNVKNNEQQISLALNSYKRQSGKIIQNFQKKINTLQKQLYDKNKQNQSLQLSLLKTQRQKQAKNRQIELLKQEQIKLSKRLQKFANVSADSQKYESAQNKIYQLQQKYKKLDINYEQTKQEFRNYKIEMQRQIQKQKRQFNNKLRQKEEILHQNSREHSKLSQNQRNDKYFSSPNKKVQFNLKNSNVKVQNIRSQIVQKLDTDYANNMTHPSKISNLLDINNTLLFKKVILGIKNKANDSKPQLLYSSQNISIAVNLIQTISSAKKQVNHIPTLKLQFIYQLNSIKSSKPITKFYNIQQIQLWTKPIVDCQSLYKQQMIVKALRFPFRIMKGSIWENQNQFNNKRENDQGEIFLLPFLYYSFLRHEQFNNQEFAQIFEKKKQNIIKSKVISINQKTIRQPFIELAQVFEGKVQNNNRNDHNQNKIKFCLSQSQSDKQKQCTFMCEVQILNKYKCLLRILPIPFTKQMGEKSKQLMQNLVFLLS